MKEFSCIINDPLGIHARPAGLLVKKIMGFESNATIIRGSNKCDGKKMLALMKMRVKAGEEITLQFEGNDEMEAVNAVKDYLSEIL